MEVEGLRVDDVVLRRGQISKSLVGLRDPLTGIRHAACFYGVAAGFVEFFLRFSVQTAAHEYFNRIVDFRDRQIGQLFSLRMTGRDLDAIDQVSRRSFVLQHVDDAQHRRDSDDFGSFKPDSTNQSSEARRRY